MPALQPPSFGGTFRGSAAQPQAAIGRVGLSTETRLLSVMPGSSILVPLTVLNQGPVVDSFTTTVEEVPENWVLLPPPLIRLLPGSSQNINLTIQPPRVPQSKAGSYLLIIRVTSQDAPDQSAILQLPLTIEPFHQFKSELKPEKVRAGRQAKIIVYNQGNSPEAIDLKWQDPADELSFSPPQANISVVEGQANPVAFRAHSKQRRLIGMDKQHPFSVLVTPAGSSPVTQPGQAVSGALIPIWVPPLLMVACIAIAACLSLFFVKPPVIQSFTYEPSIPVPGQPVKITWAVNNAQRLEFSPPVANLDPTRGFFVFSDPSGVPRDLTLTATNLFGTDQRPLNFGFVQPTPVPTATPTPTTEPGAPIIEEWSVSPAIVPEGGLVTIRWKVSNADSVTVQPFGTVDSSGQMTDTPHQTKTYSLMAVNKGKTVQRNQEVFVQLPPTPDVVGTLQAANAAQQQTATALQQAQAAQTQAAGAQETKQAGQAATAAAKQTQTAVAQANKPTPTLAVPPTKTPTPDAIATRLAQYNGTWANDDANTSGITRIIISNNQSTVTVHPFGKCSPTDCDWQAKSGPFFVDPFKILFDFGGGLTHQLTLSREGAKLRVIDVGSSSGTHTYLFHSVVVVPPFILPKVTLSIQQP